MIDEPVGTPYEDDLLQAEIDFETYVCDRRCEFKGDCLNCSDEYKTSLFKEKGDDE